MEQQQSSTVIQLQQQVAEHKAYIEQQQLEMSKLECYFGNLGELVQQIDQDIVFNNDGKPDFKTEVVPVINAVIAKVKEGAQECHGIEVNISLPFWLKWALDLVGIKI